MQITVRGATGNDVSAIASVTAQVQELHAHSDSALFKTNVSTWDLEDAVRQHLSDKSQRVVVAVRVGVTVGYARLEVQHRPPTVITFARAQLYIHEFGVAHSARAIRRIGVDVFVHNDEARHFYESRGFAVEREVRWLIPLEQGETEAPVR